MASASLVDHGCSKERLIEKIGGQTIECGSDYLLADVGENNVPFVEYSAAKEDKLYTVVMIDPDAPSNANPKFRSWLHYLAVNVKGGDLKDGVSLSDLQTEIMEYNPPTPPKGTGLHRYIIYVMEQDSRSTLEKGCIKKRKSFDIDEFVKTNNLGNLAVASNMFKTQTK